ncbi:MAG: 4Fe-4S dicluster domain-containing protein [Chloroflexi bacterium]|nr:4Fe-4S dicluster domain-containing protein [Chloroflexota bacterium]
MGFRVDPNLMYEIKEYGAAGIEKCFNCGNCTAICQLTSNEYPFPRNLIRKLQIGHRDQLIQSLDPWLCYYCGECSETCPKGAEPGETMMALRRWLTAQYDWTRLSGKIYKSNSWIITMLLVAAIIVIGLAVLLSGPMITSQVELNTFAPVHLIHTADLILAAVLGIFLLSNLARMYFFVFNKDELRGIPLKVYLTEAWTLIFHTATQNRFSKCDNSKQLWINHLITVAGYGTMFILIVVFLGWFQTDNIYPIYHPQRWLGYLAAGALIFGGVEAIRGRIRKEHEMHKYSHPSDWLFPILLVLLALSGLTIHFVRYAGLPLATYYSYVAHLVIMMMLYVTVGPMGKWAHLLYRPFAVYFQAVKAKAKEVQNELSAVPAAVE